MKASVSYVLAAVLTAASIPMYVYIFRHSSEAPVLRDLSPTSARPVVSYQVSPPFRPVPTCTQAMIASDEHCMRAAQALQAFNASRMLSKTQHCYGGAIVEHVGNTYTSVNGINGTQAHCSDGYADRPIRLIR